MIDPIIANLYEYYRDIGSCVNVNYTKTSDYESIKANVGSWPKMIFNVNKSIPLNEILPGIKKEILENILPPFIIFEDTENYNVNHDLLSNLGFQPVMKWSGMSLSATNGNSLNRNFNFNHEKVISSDQVISFVNILNKTLLLRNNASNDVFSAIAEIPEINLWITNASEKIVASSVNYINSNVAGLYMIATLEKFRGKGIGTEITKKAISDSLNKGVDEIVLHATKLGERIYSKLGFKHRCNLYIYWLVGK